MNPADDKSIEHFIRGTLGCGCPDEAFRSVAVEHVRIANDPAQYVRVLVGDRLLIFVLHAGHLEQLDAAVSALALRGRAERDRAGLNRFRMVVVADEPARVTTAATTGFTDAIGRDDRAQLHVISADRLPPALR